MEEQNLTTRKSSFRLGVTVGLLVFFLAFTNSAAAVSSQAASPTFIPRLPYVPSTQADTYHDFVCLLNNLLIGVALTAR